MKMTAQKVKEILAAQIGVEPEDLNDEDSFTEDLHMTHVDLTDFGHKLTEAGAEASDFDLSITETLGELLESLGLTVDQNG